MSWAKPFLILTCLWFPNAAFAEATPFFQGSYEAGQRTAERQSQRMVVKVYADWCGPCRRLQADVFATSLRADVVRDGIALAVNFDAPDQQHLMKKWNILNLPTVLFLRPDGSEIGRVEGYEEKTTFLAATKKLSEGHDPLPALIGQWKNQKRHSPKEVVLRVQVGHRKLVRGDSAEGIRLLESAVVADANGQMGAAERALFFLGRYYSRVLKNHAEGRHIWRTLHVHFPSGRYANTAAWWYASDLAKMGRYEEGTAFLRRRAQDETAELSALWALVEFEAKFGTVTPATLNLINKRSMSDAQRKEFKVFLKPSQPMPK